MRQPSGRCMGNPSHWFGPAHLLSSSLLAGAFQPGTETQPLELQPAWHIPSQQDLRGVIAWDAIKKLFKELSWC